MSGELISGIVLALIASVLAPSLLAFFNARSQQASKAQEWEQRRKDKESEWAHTKEVEDRAAAALKLLADKQEQTAQRLLDRDDVIDNALAVTADTLKQNTAASVKTAQETSKKLDTLQIWADGTQTALMQDQLDARESELAMMELLRFSRPSSEADGRIDALAAMIKALRAKIESRHQQQRAIDKAEKKQGDT